MLTVNAVRRRHRGQSCRLQVRPPDSMRLADGWCRLGNASVIQSDTDFSLDSPSRSLVPPDRLR